MVEKKDILTQKINIIQMIYKSGRAAHLSSAFSVLEIINVLLRDVMHLKNNDVSCPESDKLVLSKGHAALALYAVYHTMGIFSDEEFIQYQQFNSLLGVHPDRHKVPGVEVSTGSLGHGLPVATGIAYGWKLKKMPNRVFVIVGDSELCEGSNWEAIYFASRMNLSNMCCIIDDNRTADDIGNVCDKFESFGWNPIEVDGHDISILKKTLSYESERPFAIVAKTKKGNGISLMKQHPQRWHHHSISDEEYKRFMEELEYEQNAENCT